MKTMRILVFCLFIIGCLPAYAQRECASHGYLETLIATDPVAAKAIAEAARFTSKDVITNRTTSRTSGEKVLHIPVVVHVLFNNASHNISDAQVQSQIEALNRDFRRL